jgi:hypothetical protein
MTPKNPIPETPDLAPLYGEIGELKKAQQGIMTQLTNSTGLTEKIMAAVYLAGGTRNPGQNAADASLAPQNFPAFNSGGFMSPAQPILPVNPELEPRQFQYAPGVNLRYIPRMGYGLLDFATLRGLSFACKEIRLNIEKIKSVIRGLEHEIIVDKKFVAAGGEDYQVNPKLVDRVSAFWERPDGLHDFDNFINMALEEILVTDALTVWPIPDENRLRLVDGTSIRPTTDYFGEIPQAPTPAYIQVLCGYPRWWSDRKHMYYLPMRASVFSPYGTSPIEFIIQATVQAIKKDSSLVANYTEGNVPAAFAGLPSTWTPDQIEQFTEWYNTIIQGDNARRQKLMFLPHDGSGIPVQNMTSGDVDNVTRDEMNMTVACWAYGTDKSEFGILSGSGLGGKGALQGGENATVRGMISVYTRFLSQFINAYNREVLDAPFAKSHWIGLEPPEDELVTAQVHQIYIGTVYTADYVADQLGIPEKYRIHEDSTMPVTPEGYKVDTTKVLPQGATTTTPAIQTPQEALKYQAAAIRADLKTWGEKAERFAKKGWKQEGFTDTILPEGLRKMIYSAVLGANSPEEVRAVFSDALKSAREEMERLSQPLEKSMTHPAVDPNQHVKDAAANELERAMAEYLDGLMHRIAQKAVEAM